MRRLMVLVVAAALAVALAGCGKKAELDPPPGKETKYPRSYPR